MIARHYSSLAEVAPASPLVLSIGIFDGLHLGHLRILETLAAEAQKQQALSAIWTFSSLPPKAERRRLQHPALRDLRLAQFGLQELHSVGFTPEVASLSAATFLEAVLIERLNVRGIVLGEGARLGRDRETSAEDFLELARQRGLSVTLVPHLDSGGERVSSSRIKRLVENNELSEAATLLGRPYTLGGVVRRDQGRGRELGFPTANIGLAALIHPPTGIYSAKVFLSPVFSPASLPAVVYLGTRPTLLPGAIEVVLEVHIPNWSGELVGKLIEVQPLRFLRPQRRFQSTEELQTQIARDIAAALQG